MAVGIVHAAGSPPVAEQNAVLIADPADGVDEPIALEDEVVLDAVSEAVVDAALELLQQDNPSFGAVSISAVPVLTADGVDVLAIAATPATTDDVLQIVAEQFGLQSDESAPLDDRAIEQRIEEVITEQLPDAVVDDGSNGEPGSDLTEDAAERLERAERAALLDACTARDYEAIAAALDRLAQNCPPDAVSRVLADCLPALEQALAAAPEQQLAAMTASLAAAVDIAAGDGGRIDVAESAASMLARLCVGSDEGVAPLRPEATSAIAAGLRDAVAAGTGVRLLTAALDQVTVIDSAQARDAQQVLRAALETGLNQLEQRTHAVVIATVEVIEVLRFVLQNVAQSTWYNDPINVDLVLAWTTSRYLASDECQAVFAELRAVAAANERTSEGLNGWSGAGAAASPPGDYAGRAPVQAAAVLSADPLQAIALGFVEETFRDKTRGGELAFLAASGSGPNKRVAERNKKVHQELKPQVDQSADVAGIAMLPSHSNATPASTQHKPVPTEASAVSNNRPVVTTFDPVAGSHDR
jgi:hypothetical protein